MTDDLDIKVIIGSTRQGRFGDRPARWIHDEANRREGARAELLDLRDYPMPFLEEATPPAGMGGKYPNPMVQRWAGKIDEADGFIIVTPEYNHGYPGVLKNALDSIFPEWNKKPVGFVAYGNAGGARSVEQLRQVAVELQMLPIRNALHIPPEIKSRVAEASAPVDPSLFEPMRKFWGGDRVDNFLDELIWAARMLKSARS